MFVLQPVTYSFQVYFFALLIPGVSRKMICPLSSVYTVWIRFLVVCGLLDVIAIFCPIRRFINVDFPTFGRPINVTKPDLNSFAINCPFPVFSIVHVLLHQNILYSDRSSLHFQYSSGFLLLLLL